MLLYRGSGIGFAEMTLSAPIVASKARHVSLSSNSLSSEKAKFKILLSSRYSGNQTNQGSISNHRKEFMLSSFQKERIVAVATRDSTVETVQLSGQNLRFCDLRARKIWETCMCHQKILSRSLHNWGLWPEECDQVWRCKPRVSSRKWNIPSNRCSLHQHQGWMPSNYTWFEETTTDATVWRAAVKDHKASKLWLKRCRSATNWV